MKNNTQKVISRYNNNCRMKSITIQGSNKFQDFRIQMLLHVLKLHAINYVEFSNVLRCGTNGRISL